MTFLDRMTAETGAPMPRYLYLIDKIGHTALLTLALWAVTPLPLPIASLVAAALYVGIGLALWYRHGVKQWFGPGGFFGDLAYHLLPSLVVANLVWPGSAWFTLVTVAITALLWWVLDTANYGPARDPGAPR